MLFAVLVLAALVCGLALYLHHRPDDAMTLLLLGLLVTFALPQRFVVAGLDTAGAPGLLVGVALFGLWVLNRLRPLRPLDPRPDAAPVLAGVYLAAWLVEFAMTQLLPDLGATPDSMMREIITVLSVLGVLLYTSDAIRDQQRLERLMRALTLLGAAVALVGIVQFLLGSDPLNTLRLPLLAEAPTQRPERVRAGFLRVRGTAFHPIEFSVVLGMLLPLAIGFAFRSRTPRIRRLYGVVAMLFGVASTLSISRSGVVTIAVGVVVVAMHLEWPERLRLAAGGAFALVLVYLTVPGLLGALRTLFLRAEDDPSIANRLSDIPVVLEVLRASPIVGEAAPFFIPQDRLFDNEFFVRITNGGLVGLAGLLALLIVPLLLAWARSQLGNDRDGRMLAGMVAASLATGIVSLATFDGFFFRLFTTVLLVLVAAGCAAWRLRDEDPTARDTAPVRRRPQDAASPSGPAATGREARTPHR